MSDSGPFGGPEKLSGKRSCSTIDRLPNVGFDGNNGLWS